MKGPSEASASAVRSAAIEAEASATARDRAQRAHWQFGVEHRLHPLSERTLTAAETERRIRPVLARVPITRVSDLTPLDPSGLPVFVAVTPLARDLTTHAGKGMDAASARLSAIMEAIERVSAESVAPERCVRASYVALAGQRAVDPRLFDLPHDTTYQPERTLLWVDSYDLSQCEPALLPLDLVVSPPCGGLLHDVDTNGLASGNTLLEAVVHALCELVERDSLAQLEFSARFGDPAAAEARMQPLELASLPASVRALVDPLASAGLSLSLRRLQSEIELPVFRADLVDPRYPSRAGDGAQFFAGFGCHPNAELALLRAATEAVQSRLGLIHGARDSLGSFATSMQVSPSTPGGTRAPSSFGEVPSGVFATLNEDLEFALGALRRAGFGRVLVTDLTRPDWEVPVVRVRVPGLSSFFVNRRRIDRRCLRHLLPG